MMKKSAYLWLGLAATNFIVGGAILFFTPTLNKPSQNITSINTQLDAIQVQLANMPKPANPVSDKTQIQKITNDISQLTHLIEELKSQDNTQLNQLLQESKTEFASKVDSIKDLIHEVTQKSPAINFLPVTALPFKVISIDSIQQISVVTVSYHFSTLPLEKGDKLAGWQVLSIDFAKQKAEFVNKSDEHVLLTLDDEVNDHA